MPSVISPADQWGPFALDLDPAEYIARCRTLRAIAHCIAGPRAEALCSTLATAEEEPWMIREALTALDRLDALDKRRTLATYGKLNCPAWC